MQLKSRAMESFILLCIVYFSAANHYDGHCHMQLLKTCCSIQKALVLQLDDIMCLTYTGYGYYSRVSHSGFPAAIWAESSVWQLRVLCSQTLTQKWKSGYARLVDSINVHDIMRRGGKVRYWPTLLTVFWPNLARLATWDRYQTRLIASSEKLYFWFQVQEIPYLDVTPYTFHHRVCLSAWRDWAREACWLVSYLRRNWNRFSDYEIKTTLASFPGSPGTRIYIARRA